MIVTHETSPASAEELRCSVYDFVQAAGEPVTKARLLGQIQGTASSSVGFALAKLVSLGKLRRVGWGLYEAAKASEMAEETGGPAPLASRPGQRAKPQQGTAERDEQIIDLFRRTGTVTLDQLREAFPQVSYVSLNRRIKYLADAGRIKRLGMGAYRSVDIPLRSAEMEGPADGAREARPAIKATDKIAELRGQINEIQVRGQWAEFYERIIGEAASESIFGDRRHSVIQCLLAGQDTVLQKKGRMDLARSPAELGDLPSDFFDRFELARQKLLDELTSSPAAGSGPAASTGTIPTETLMVELARRLAKALDTSLYRPLPVPELEKPQPTAVPPSPAINGSRPAESHAPVNKPKTRLRVCVIGVLESQHRHILEDPEIALWIETGVLQVTFSRKGKSLLNIPENTDLGLCWVGKVSHAECYAAREQLGKDNVEYVTGISRIREAIVAANRRFVGTHEIRPTASSYQLNKP
jgi:hypothetical protein